MTPDQRVFAADRLVQMTAVLDLAGIPYNGVPAQVSCPIHKAGGETRRSARLYPDNFIYCFTCSRQYRPTEIHAALAELSRESAAEVLLAKFPPTEQQLQGILKDYYTPRKPTKPKVLLERATQALKQYRHKVPLKVYRSWAVRLLHLQTVLMETTLELQEGKLHFYLQSMKQDFDNTNERSLQIFACSTSPKAPID